MHENPRKIPLTGVAVDGEPSATTANKNPAQLCLAGLCREPLKSVGGYLVPRAGIEPARLAAGDFESPASTNFTTWADTAVRIERSAREEDADYGRKSVDGQADRFERPQRVRGERCSDRAREPFERLLAEIAVKYHREIAHEHAAGHPHFEL